MYYHGYQDAVTAREVFGQIPADVRGALASLDYSRAERSCPQKMPIAELMRQAGELLA